MSELKETSIEPIKQGSAEQILSDLTTSARRAFSQNTIKTEILGEEGTRAEADPIRLLDEFSPESWLASEIVNKLEGSGPEGDLVAYVRLSGGDYVRIIRQTSVGDEHCEIYVLPSEKEGLKQVRMEYHYPGGTIIFSALLAPRP